LTQKSTTTFKFKKVWTFPEPVEKRIANFVEKIGGLWLHAPCGISMIGKGQFTNKTRLMTLDIDPSLKPDIICDVFTMKEHPEIKNVIKKWGGFDGVISDPLWYFSETCPKCNYKITNRTKGLAYPDRRYLSFEVRDILKPGGWWLFNGLWNAKVKGLSFADPQTNPIGASIEVAMQQFSSFRNVSLLIYYRKMNEVFGYV
jgi:hypothetical protein